MIVSESICAALLDRIPHWMLNVFWFEVLVLLPAAGVLWLCFECFDRYLDWRLKQLDREIEGKRK